MGSREASTGVYVGCVWQEYQALLEHLHVTPTVAVLTGSGMNFMIGRVSYTLGLQGDATKLSLSPACMTLGTCEPYRPEHRLLWRIGMRTLPRSCLPGGARSSCQSPKYLNPP